MSTKKILEEQYITLHTQEINETTAKNNQILRDIQLKIASIDAKISNLLQEQQLFFNPKWERMFRAGAEESYFAYQVDRFACIYMEKLSDLLEYSPLTYFRANKRLLAHDCFI